MNQWLHHDTLTEAQRTDLREDEQREIIEQRERELAVREVGKFWRRHKEGALHWVSATPRPAPSCFTAGNLVNYLDRVRGECRVSDSEVGDLLADIVELIDWMDWKRQQAEGDYWESEFWDMLGFIAKADFDEAARVVVELHDSMKDDTQHERYQAY